MKDYLLYLFLGHILGDFYFQTEKIARLKDRSYKGVLIHSFEYLLIMIALAIPFLSVDMLLAAGYASAVHWVIDSGKYIVKKKKHFSDLGMFVIDQMLHAISIIILALTFCVWHFIVNGKQIIALAQMLSIDTYVLKWVLSILLIHKPVNIFIQKFLKDYKPADDKNTGNDDIINREKNIGRIIGTIERIVMLILISRNQYAALGLVLTAKSITRYDRIVKDKAFAEYYLLGTLMSVLCVLVISVIVTI
ncbi:DUF3307 domain-containing protein [Butyrivibrio sp. AE2015]|uniref:DUF3307 domain-containing protein n=1 Tax=Butyrivibrio sp. AE2015 TaxID=1280663 RepID=UPI0003B5A30D|nr:DUF3307 domain-containing protein [Butyrivibrio sp. AE2015]